jgi:hypothetical protein
MAPPKFKDFLKESADLLGDDFVSKKIVKMKCKAGGMTFKTADELKMSGTSLKSVTGKIETVGPKFENGLELDKLVFKGSDIAVDLVYPFLGAKNKLKTELKGDGAFAGALELEKKFATMTATAAVNSKSKVDLSLAGSFAPLTLGGAISYLADSGALKAYDAGAQYKQGPLLVGLKTANKFDGLAFGATYTVSPLLTCALTGAYPKLDSAVFGGTYKYSKAITTKAKVSKNALEMVACTKCADGLKVDVGATLPFADMIGAASFGFQISLG